MQSLGLLLQREVIIGLALAGGVISTTGGYLLRKNSTTRPNTARLILRTGYAVSWASVAAFIAVGFLSGW